MADSPELCNESPPPETGRNSNRLRNERNDIFMVSREYIRKHIDRLEYLGFCQMKGWLYSEYLGDGHYRIIAISNTDNSSTVLISFKGRRPRENNTSIRATHGK